MVKLRQDVAAAYQAGHPSAMPMATGRMTLSNLTFDHAILPTGWTVWRIPAGASVPEVVRQLKGQQGIYSVEPNYIVRPALATPNDGDWGVYETDPDYYLGFTDLTGIEFKKLWHLDDDSAFSAWSQWPNKYYTASTLPADRPIIAFIDSGCDMTHPDFINASGTGTDTSQGGQFITSESGSLINGVWTPGAGSVADPDAGGAMDGNGHGTHVTGLALAAANNGASVGSDGVIGTGYNCRGIVLKIFTSAGAAYDSDVDQAIIIAADDGASVINLSLAISPYSQYSQALQDAMNYAFQKGSLPVAAGAETGDVQSSAPGVGAGYLGQPYPGASSSALCVTADGAGQLLSTISGNGQFIDVAAPGGDFYLDQINITMIIQFVWSTATTYSSYLTQADLEPPYLNNYTYLAGTSMATPQVSGAAGLYMGSRGLTPGGWNNVATFRAIETAADDINGDPHGTWDTLQGYGALDMSSLIAGTNQRGADWGGIKGIIYLGGTVIGNVKVTAQSVNGGTIYSTTTLADGTYRFEGMPTGIYAVTASPYGNSKTQYARVEAGCDQPAEDLWCGTYTGDATPPVVPYFGVLSATTSTVNVEHWGYDPDTSIAYITFRIGTSSGGSNVMADTRIVPGDNDQAQLTGLSLQPGTTYYLQGTYTNGAGMTTTVTTTFTVGSASHLSGHLALGRWVGPQVPINYIIRKHGSMTTVATGTFTPDSSWNFTINYGTPGMYDVLLTFPRYLNRLVQGVVFGAGSSNVNVGMIGGDANGDNMVSSRDYGPVKLAMGSSPGDHNWNQMADLDGSGHVDMNDVQLIKRYMGASGAN